MSSTLIVESGPADGAGAATTICLPMAAGIDGPEPWPGTNDVVESFEAPDPALLARRGFAAKVGDSLVLTSGQDATVVLVGTGVRASADAETWRRAGAAAVRAAGSGSSVAFVLPAAEEEGGTQRNAEAVATGALLAAYRFEEYQRTPKSPGPERLVLLAPGEDEASLDEGIGRARALCAAVVFARDLVNRPPSDLNPRQLADAAIEFLDGAAGVTVEVWDEERIVAERLGGLLGVARGSVQPPRLVRADYVPPDASGEPAHIVLVGKGITFDSGGLSLKTAEGMTTMKTDMSGAAIVLGALGAAAALGVGARVTAIAPITENMPGDAAIKPGDVLITRDGQSIEVLNTDAEGRLVLADGLALAAEMGPTAIIDVATLTGAAVVALGGSIGALFSNDPELRDALEGAGARAGEALWPLPLAEAYRDHIDSDIADMKNMGKPGQAGAIAAALLLERFVGETRWAHLDIAGPARAAESGGYLPKGGTAFSLRALLEYLDTF